MIKEIFIYLFMTAFIISAVSACKNCNTAKMTLSEGDFLPLIKDIYKNKISKWSGVYEL